MERTNLEQALEAIRTGARILIALPVNPSFDAVASGLALATVLKTLGKTTALVSSQFSLPPSLGFLPKKHDIDAQLDTNQKLVITVHLNQAKVEELSYGVEDDALKIFVTPKGGSFNANDVAASASGYSYDVIITLDALTLADLGTVFETNAEFFYHTPIVNIDHHPSNESFGQINVVDLVATSTAEIVLELLQQLKPGLVDDAVATNLLTGIITKTRCFRTSSVTPKSLAAASQLIEAGAQREEIIKHLYQTRSLPTLKLWGRALARLKDEFHGQLVWTTINQQDFERSGTDVKALEGVIDELIMTTPHARILAILYEATPDTVRAIVSSNRQIQAREMFRGIELAGNDEYATLTFSKATLATAEAELLKRVETHLRERGLLG